MIHYFEQIPLWSNWTRLGFLGYVLFRVTSEKRPGQTAACLKEAVQAGGGRRDLQAKGEASFPSRIFQGESQLPVGQRTPRVLRRS